MADSTVYFATNRRHRGRDQWNPRSYGIEHSKTHAENLRFGKVTLSYDEERAQSFLDADCGFGTGQGDKLATFLKRKYSKRKITAFKESLDAMKSDRTQKKSQFGSTRTFAELQEFMNNTSEVLVYVHGFSVDWWSAVASALSLQLMLNRHHKKQVMVFLFSWPSDGRKIPWWSYLSDRSDADKSGYAFGRGFLKLRDYLVEARKANEPLCDGSIHLLCHSMGSYVLQCALERVCLYSAGGKPSQVFDQIFLCAPDISDDVFGIGKPMQRLPEAALNVTIYHNKGDLSMPLSDHTKGNTARLGWGGPSHSGDLGYRTHAVDCSQIVTGFIEHSYYLCGRVNDDIRQSIDQIAPNGTGRARSAVSNAGPNVWYLRNS